MGKVDHLIYGIFLGLASPLIAFISISIIKLRVELLIQESFIYIVCIGINALLFRIFIKMDCDKTAKGILLVTFIYALAFFWFKGQELG